MKPPMTGITAWLFERAKPLWDEIASHPFVLSLYRGDLPLERFRYYVLQDYNYLLGMMRTFSLIASKSPPWLASTALEIAYSDATVEMANYRRLLPRVGLTFEEVLRSEPAPTNTAYMNFLVSTAALQPPLISLTAVLPCFWSYQYIAEKNAGLLESNPNPLYKEWASVYLSSEYASLVKKLRDAVDRLYEESCTGREELWRVFLTGTRYEKMFWDMALHGEAWPFQEK